MNFCFGSIVVDGALTRCTLLHCVCDLKITQMNVQSSLMWEIMLYEEFEQGNNAIKETFLVRKGKLKLISKQ